MPSDPPLSFIYLRYKAPPTLPFQIFHISILWRYLIWIFRSLFEVFITHVILPFFPLVSNSFPSSYFLPCDITLLDFSPVEESLPLGFCRFSISDDLSHGFSSRLNSISEYRKSLQDLQRFFYFEHLLPELWELFLELLFFSGFIIPPDLYYVNMFFQIFWKKLLLK